MFEDKATVSFKEAKKLILSSITPLGCEEICILDAYNRVLCENIVSDVMIPPLDNSSMDGYAILADDLHGVSQENPIRLKVIGEIQAGGSNVGHRVVKGAAIRIMTGAPMPEGADTVIPFEDTEENDGYVHVFRATVKHKNYRLAGENIAEGDVVLSRGDRLNSADIGVLASLSRKSVKVYKRATVSIISTGDELIGIDEELKFGQIRDVNAYTLYAEIKKYNGLPEYLGIAKDSPEAVEEMFLKALKSDVVISTGGVSMGRYDFVKEVHARLDVQTRFECVDMRPGKPLTFGTKGNKLIFGLPGNPVSTLTSFIQFVRPALLLLMGAKKISKPLVGAYLQEDITNKQLGKVNLLRGYLTVKDNKMYVSTTGSQKVSVFRSMSEANCLIRIPENVTEVKAGEEVTIQLIHHEEI
jgi:molybdopterin molybdotransferase